MPVPGRFDHHQRIPGVDQDATQRLSAPSQEGQNGRDQPDLDPQEGQLEAGNGTETQIEESMDHLGEGGIDGRDLLVVDGGPDWVSVLLQYRRLRAVFIGIDPFRLQMAFPQVAVDVVGQRRRGRQQQQPECEGKEKNEGQLGFQTAGRLQ